MSFIKVYYKVAGDPPARKRRAVSEPTQYDLVGPEKTSHTLRNLQTYKEYLITITAYNIAGEGPPSEPMRAVTDQGGKTTSSLSYHKSVN